MVQFKIRYTGATPKLAKRVLRQVTKTAFLNVGIFWHKQFRPKHFTKAGAREYGYEPRKGESGNPHRRGFRRSYTGIKLRRFGHTRPLVWTGESQRLTQLRDVRATSKGVRIVLRAPTFNRRSKHSRIDMRAELTTVSARETKQIVRLFGRLVERQLNALRDRETVVLT